MSEKIGNSASNSSPQADKWDILRDEIKNNFLDDEDFIKSKSKHPIEYSKEDAARDLKNAEAKRDKELKEIDDLEAKLKSIQNRTKEEYDKEHYEEFVGETNKNSKTGKERTFNDFDNYSKESGEDRKRRHDLTVISEYIAKLPDEDAASYSKRISDLHDEYPRKDDETLESYRERIKAASESSEIYQKAASHIVDPEGEANKWLEDELKNIEEWQSNGRIDSEKANKFKRELYDRAIIKQLEINRENEKSDIEKGQAEDKQPKTPELSKEQEIQKLKSLHFEKAKAAAMQKAAYEDAKKLNELYRDQMKEYGRDLVIMQDQILDNMQYNPAQKKKSAEFTPLTAINIDYSHDEQELARDLAEQTLNAEISSAKGPKGFIKSLWKGTLFRKAYEISYAKKIASGKLKTENGETAMDVLRKQMPDTMERFVLGAVEKEDKYIHDKSGEKLEKVDAETNEKIKNAIMDYARKRPGLGEDLTDLNREFKGEIGRILAQELDDAKEEKSRDNYLKVAEEAYRRYEIAINAKQKIEHEAALMQVMEGFQAYNAEARSNIRTEAHYDGIDALVNKIESKGFTLIPGELIAAAAGAAFALTQTGVRALAGAGGGILASGALGALKERNRITEDRVRMMRDIANGMDYDGRIKSKEEIKKMKGQEKKTAEYEAEISGTLYDTLKATKLTEQLNAVMDPENRASSEEILRAIAEARVRIDYSDSAQKDLIAYSSADNRGKERLALDIAVIRAEKSLSDKDKDSLELLKAEIQKEIDSNVDENDKEFKHLRVISAAKKAGKSVIIGGALFLLSQELLSIADPTKIGFFEKLGIDPGKIHSAFKNNDDAKETLIAKTYGAISGNRGTYDVPGTGIPAASRTVATRVSDKGTIEYCKNNPDEYTIFQDSDGFTINEPRHEPVDPSASAARVRVKYDGWANNSTKFSDGNELRAHIENGKFVSTMRGASTMRGETINYDPSNIKAYITVGDAKFEVEGTLNEATGQMTWGENGVFNIVTPEGVDGTTATVQAIGDNGEKLYKYFEIAVDNGPDVDGVTRIIPLATDVGTDSFTGQIQTFTEVPVSQGPTYTIIRKIAGRAARTATNETDYFGIGFAPETARTGLGRATARAAEVPTSPEPELDLEPTPAPEPAPAPEPNSEAPDTAETDKIPPEPALETPVGVVNPVGPQDTANAGEPAGEASAQPTGENTHDETIVVTPLISEGAPDEVRDFVGNYQREIFNHREAIGDEAVDLLLSNINPTQDAFKKIREVLSALSPSGKTAMRELLDMRDDFRNNSDDVQYIEFGNALDSYLATYGDGILN